MEPPLPWWHLHRLQELGSIWQQQQHHTTLAHRHQQHRVQEVANTAWHMGTAGNSPSRAQGSLHGLGGVLLSPRCCGLLRASHEERSQSSEVLWSIQRGVPEGRGGRWSHSSSWLLLTPLPCRTCASAAPEGPSSSPAQPPSSRGLWPRSSCLWTGIEPCVAPTGKSVTSPLGHPMEVLVEGLMQTHVVQGPHARLALLLLN